MGYEGCVSAICHDEHLPITWNNGRPDFNEGYIGGALYSTGTGAAIGGAFGTGAVHLPTTTFIFGTGLSMYGLANEGTQAYSNYSQGNPFQGTFHTVNGAFSVFTLGQSNRGRWHRIKLTEAQRLQLELIAKHGREHATYVGGYDRSGRTTAGHSRPNHDRTSNVCSEGDVAQQLGGDANFTGPLRPRPGRVEVPVCPRCQSNYEMSQYPPNTPYEPGGAWPQTPSMRTPYPGYYQAPAASGALIGAEHIELLLR